MYRLKIDQSHQTNGIRTHVKVVHRDSMFSTLHVLILNDMRGYHGTWFIHLWVTNWTHASVHILGFQDLARTFTGSGLLPSSSHILKHCSFASRQFFAQRLLFFFYTLRGRILYFMLPEVDPYSLCSMRPTLVWGNCFPRYHLFSRGSWFPYSGHWLYLYPRRRWLLSIRCLFHICPWGSWFSSLRCLFYPRDPDSLLQTPFLRKLIFFSRRLCPRGSTSLKSLYN